MSQHVERENTDRELADERQRLQICVWERSQRDPDFRRLVLLDPRKALNEITTDGTLLLKEIVVKRTHDLDRETSDIDDSILMLWIGNGDYPTPMTEEELTDMLIERRRFLQNIKFDQSKSGQE